MKQTYNNFCPKFQCILEKNTLKKYDLQESYNNFKIKLKISFCESGPWIKKLFWSYFRKIYTTQNNTQIFVLYSCDIDQKIIQIVLWY